jgi:membrane protein DedA with SNARE-associated domain
MNETAQFLVRYGPALVFAAVFLEQLGLPLPALPWLLAVGALSTTGKFSPLLGLGITVLACLLADTFWFYLGRSRGHRVLGLLCRVSLDYCSCPNEVSSARVAMLLRRKGIAAVRPLLGGIDAWRKLNYPLEQACCWPEQAGRGSPGC